MNLQLSKSTSARTRYSDFATLIQMLRSTRSVQLKPPCGSKLRSFELALLRIMEFDFVHSA